MRAPEGRWDGLGIRLMSSRGGVGPDLCRARAGAWAGL